MMLLDYHGISEPHGLEIHMISAVHDSVCEWIEREMLALGLNPKREYYVETDVLCGSIDILWEGGIIDVKTSNPWNFRKLKEGKNGWWDCQIEAYMRMADVEVGHVIIVDRAGGKSGSWVVREVHRDDKVWDKAMVKVLTCQQCLESGDMSSAVPFDCSCNSAVSSYCKIGNVDEFIAAVKEALV